MNPRCMHVASVFALLVMLSACGGGAGEDAGGSFAPGPCPGNWANIALDVWPDRVTRGEAVTIEITWQVSELLSEPAVATLLTADDAIEVDVMLSLELGVSGPFTYYGQQLNPFGGGAPPGLVSVLASSTPIIA